MPSNLVSKVLVVAASFIAVAGGAFWLGTQRAATAPAAATPPKSSGAPAKSAPAIAVDAVRVQTTKLPITISAVGSLRSNESVVLRPEVSGRVSEIGFQEGQPMKKGEFLLRLDASVQRADLAQAEANLALAYSRAERARDLHKKGFISSQALDEAESTYKVSKASAQVATARLSKLELRAPFDGVVGLRQVSVGDYVREGQDLVNLEKIDVLKVDFRVPEQFLKQLSVGQSLQINLDALPNVSVGGSILAINPLLDANGRAVVMRAGVRNADNRLRPGMFARIRLLAKETADTMVIPEQAIFAVGDEFFVYKLVDDRAVRSKVEIGQRNTGVVEILNGLTRADTVVSAGQPKLRDGARVQLATLDGMRPETTASKGAPPPGGQTAPAK